MECSLKTEGLEEVAQACAGALAVNYQKLAADWRHLARQAAWQEEFDEQDDALRH